MTMDRKRSWYVRHDYARLLGAGNGFCANPGGIIEPNAVQFAYWRSLLSGASAMPLISWMSKAGRKGSAASHSPEFTSICKSKASAQPPSSLEKWLISFQYYHFSGNSGSTSQIT